MSKCILCNNNPYVVIRFISGNYLHLCKSCWEKIKIFTIKNKKGKEGKSCPVCKYTIEEFNEYRFLGCDFCYEYFYNEVISYLKRIHTVIFYKGKYPERFKNQKNGLKRIFDVENSIDKIEIVNEEFK